jgi:P4 family phage/plasmid primase-like protien
MDLWTFVNGYKTNDSKQANLTSIKGGKWNIPQDKVKHLYKEILKAHKDGEILPPFAEKVGDEHPLIFDLDAKYDKLYETRQYSLSTLQFVCEYLWSTLREVIVMDDINSFNEVYVMTKQHPYPCNKGDYKSKDGIHIIFPKVVLKKEVYKIICNKINETKETLFDILKNTCENPPTNLDDTLIDSSFSRWMPYLCHKEGEEPYLLEEVFVMSSSSSDRKNPDLVNGPLTFYTPDVLMMETSMIKPNIKENVSYTTEVENQLKSKSKHKTSMVAENSSDDIYGGHYVDNNNVIHPYQIVEEEELKLITRLCECLTVNRASVYGDWLNVGLALYNTNPQKLLPVWEKFSQKYSKYRDGSSKRDCSKKWESFKNSNTGNPVTAGSIRYWAKEDDPEMYNRILIDSLDLQIKNSVSHGPDAHHLIGLVIHKYYQDQFLCVDISDDWYFFNGVRWKKTLKANELKRRIHTDIYNIYHEYEHKFKLEANKESDPDEKDKWVKKQSKCLTFMQKLLQENYVNTLIGALRHLFYKENIAEKFDSNVNLLGLDNCVVDLKEWVLREGRPEDYITKTTGFEMPIGDVELPIKLGKLNSHLSTIIPNYNRYKQDLLTFIKQIIPIDEVRNYSMRWLSKCLSGENRDEGFYIWTGSGGNGKSKLIELMQMVLGEYACGLPVSLITSKRASSNSATPEMERTKGVRLVVMQEPEADENINIGLMKELTGNDKIIARGLYKEPVEFNPQFKMLLMCNDLPSIPSNDDGTWRRLQVVDFISKFVSEEDYDLLNDDRHIYKRDKEMRNKLPAWKIIFAGILLEEWMEYDVNGIDVPPQVNSKTKSYRDANNDVARWIGDCCQTVDNVDKKGIYRAPTSIGDLVDDFEDWAKENGCKLKKSKIKEELLKWQEKSIYGLSLGKLMSDGCPNGTRKKPLLNLVILEDDEEDDDE